MDAPEINITLDNLKLISEIDEFKGKWQVMSYLAPDQLEALKKVATVESIGSSTRIEGARLTDREVKELLSGLEGTKLQSRDEEEVAGYAECIETVFESFDHIPVDENHLKQLHQRLLKYSTKDVRHRGEYKTLPNHVEAFDPHGERVGTVFETASPFDTPRLMEELIEWFTGDWKQGQTHPLLLIAIFIVHFLAIHPFQDGNGRLSRIVTNLLLLQAGYSYAPYSSLERVIEENKNKYYLALRETQKTLYTDNSTLGSWVTFFLQSIRKQVAILERKIKNEERLSEIPPLSKDLIQIAKDHGRLTVRDAVRITQANRNTVKLHIKKLVNRGMLHQEGEGKGTWYMLA